MAESRINRDADVFVALVIGCCVEPRKGSERARGAEKRNESMKKMTG